MFYVIQQFRWEPDVWDMFENENEVRDFLKDRNSEWGEVTIIEGKERYIKEFEDKGGKQ